MFRDYIKTDDVEYLQDMWPVAKVGDQTCCDYPMGFTSFAFKFIIQDIVSPRFILYTTVAVLIYSDLFLSRTHSTEQVSVTCSESL